MQRDFRKALLLQTCDDAVANEASVAQHVYKTCSYLRLICASLNFRGVDFPSAPLLVQTEDVAHVRKPDNVLALDHLDLGQGSELPHVKQGHLFGFA